MKNLKQPKQLNLATETVRALDNAALSQVAGGLHSNGPDLPCTSGGLKYCRQ